VKLLLTSAGIKNHSIRDALVDMLGKPIEQSTAFFIPTAAHPLGPCLVWRATQDFMELPWKEYRSSRNCHGHEYQKYVVKRGKKCLI